jgi:hypothetical protein
MMILQKQRSSSIFCLQILFFFCGRFMNRPYNNGFGAYIGEHTYFVGVGALDDPENNQLLQYNRRA